VTFAANDLACVRAGWGIIRRGSFERLRNAIHVSHFPGSIYDSSVSCTWSVNSLRIQIQIDISSAHAVRSFVILLTLDNGSEPNKVYKRCDDNSLGHDEIEHFLPRTIRG
jgi:hypothetical protein